MNNQKSKEENTYLAHNHSMCSIIHSNSGLSPQDKEGCLLVDRHNGPHEFKDTEGTSLLQLDF